MAEIKNTKAFYNTVIPSDWDIKKLGDLGKVVSGLTYSPDDICEETGVLVLRSSNVQGGQITFDDNVFVKVKERDFNPVENGDILICVRNGSKSLIGKCALINEKSAGLAFGAFMAIYRGKYNNYLIHVFNTDIYNREIHRNLGATINSINGSDLKEFKIPLPPLHEQKAIAQVLSTADTAIHTTEKLIAQKELRKKWLMQQLLTGKKRLKGFGGEWKEMHLGDMFTERNETKFFDLPLLSIGQNGVYPQDESVKKDTSNEDKSKYKRICPGDIGYNTMRMWQGRSALSELEGIVSPAYTVVTPKINADSIFFSYLFKMPKMTNLFWRNSQGLVDDTLNCKFKDFSIVKVKLPQAKEEQTAIAQVLQAADKEISLLKAKAEKLREQKKGLMQQLLTGKVRLKI
jgi:type I restriction enzyme S subunit